MTADGAAQRKGWAARHELALRNAMEALLRTRHPDARMCHEMVMGAREVRADLVAVSPGHIAAVEVKGQADNLTRLLHQVGLYQLCVPEVWMVVSADKRDDARLIQYLLPSVGLIAAHNIRENWRYSGGDAEVRLEIEAEPVPRQPHPLMMLEMMWAGELRRCCVRTRVGVSAKTTRPKMIAALVEAVPPGELLAECCTELRGRDALWRADAPVPAKVAG